MTLLHLLTLDYDLINILEPTLTQNILSSEIAYNKTNPLMFFIDSLPVVKCSNTEILLSLQDNTELKLKLNQIDNKIISLIQERKILKTWGLKKYSYTPLVSTYTNAKEETFDVLRLNILPDGEFKTSIFYKYGYPVDNINVINSNAKVKTIVEFFTVQFNTETNNISIYNGIRQLKVKILKPKRIKNLQYSFVDSDNDDIIDSVKQDNVKQDSVKQDSVKQDSVKQETSDETNTDEDEAEDANKIMNKLLEQEEIYEQSSNYDDISQSSDSDLEANFSD